MLVYTTNWITCTHIDEHMYTTHMCICTHTHTRACTHARTHTYTTHTQHTHTTVAVSWAPFVLPQLGLQQVQDEEEDDRCVRCVLSNPMKYLNSSNYPVLAYFNCSCKLS